MKKEEKESLDDLKIEAYSALRLLDSVTNRDLLEKFPDVNDSLYRSKFNLKDLMGKIDYTIKHSEIED